MDASQYKDYILTLLFVKYVSDKFTGEDYADVEVPEGGSFDDMVARNVTNPEENDAYPEKVRHSAAMRRNPKRDM